MENTVKLLIRAQVFIKARKILIDIFQANLARKKAMDTFLLKLEDFDLEYENEEQEKELK